MTAIRPKERRAMTKHKTGTRAEWLAARLELLKAEKDLTRQSDALARQRQGLPRGRVGKQDCFETDEGEAALTGLFRGGSPPPAFPLLFRAAFTAGRPASPA